MGRFNDLWASGKFAMQRNKEADASRLREAAERASELSPELAVPDSSKAIFDALKAKRGQETGRWLNGLLPANVEKPMETQAASTTAFEEVTAWIDKLGAQFDELTYEFNKKAIGTNLYVSCEKPRLFEKRNDDVWYRPVEKSYKGRLTTRDWAMIVRGQEHKISVFVIPAEMVMAFDTDTIGEDEMPPLMEIARTTDGANSVWKIGGEVVPIETMPHLAKELFGDLIRLSSGVMSEAELMGHHEATLSLGENIAVGYQPEVKPVATPAASVQAQQNSSSDAGDNAPDQVISKACDIVDEILDQELKQLYATASQYKPGTPESSAIRRKISATETFHNKIIDAFKEYTHAILISQSKADVGNLEPELSK